MMKSCNWKNGLRLFMVFVFVFIFCFQSAFAEGEEESGGSEPVVTEPEAGATEGPVEETPEETSAVVVPSDADKALVTVSNVEEACKVTAFRIVKPVYNVYGIERYELVSGAEIADLLAPTHAEVTLLAKKSRAGSFTEKVDFTNVSGTTTFTAELAAGSWIVLITDPTDAEYVYNPMFVSAYYTNANDASSLVGGTANAAEDFTIGASAYFAKRSKIDLQKEIVSEGRKNPKFDDYKVGNTASFTVETLTPVYDAAYTDIWYYLVDDQCKGLDPATNFRIEYSEDNGATWIEVESSDYTLEKDVEATSIKYVFSTGFTNQGTGNDWAINFKPAFLVAHPAANLRIFYDSVVNDNSLLATKENVNEVELAFTNDIYGHESHRKDTVRYYTFTVDQAVKIDETGELLSGAVFALIEKGNAEQSLEDASKYLMTYTTKADGRIVFDGLDAKTYQMKEVKAPDNHFLNGTVYDVTIAPEYDETTLEIVSYTVTITDGTGAAVSKVAATGEVEESLTKIIDPTLSKLPSTGGIGTTLFTIFGTLIMLAGAAFILYKACKTV